jgi:hypothetical protein
MPPTQSPPTVTPAPGATADEISQLLHAISKLEATVAREHDAITRLAASASALTRRLDRLHSGGEA